MELCVKEVFFFLSWFYLLNNCQYIENDNPSLFSLKGQTESYVLFYLREMKVSLCSVCLHELMKDYIFIQNSLLQSGSWCASFEIVLLKSFLFLFFFSFCFCCLAGFSGHRIHIKKHGSVVECYVHVCWYTVLWRVCVRGVQIVGCVFSSSLFVLMFAANMTTVTSPLKAQAPTLLPF